jgi:hypothetical protein
MPLDPTLAEAADARQAVLRAAAVIRFEHDLVKDAVSAILAGAEPPPLPRHPGVERPSKAAASALNDLAKLCEGHVTAMNALAHELKRFAEQPLGLAPVNLPDPPARIRVEPPAVPTLIEMREHAESLPVR